MAGKALVEARRRLDAVGAAHVNVHQHQVDRHRGGLQQRVVGVVGFGHHAQVRHRLEPRAQAVAHQRVVVDQHDPDNGGRHV